MLCPFYSLHLQPSLLSQLFQYNPYLFRNLFLCILLPKDIPHLSNLLRHARLIRPRRIPTQHIRRERRSRCKSILWARQAQERAQIFPITVSERSICRERLNLTLNFLRVARSLLHLQTPTFDPDSGS